MDVPERIWVNDNDAAFVAGDEAFGGARCWVRADLAATREAAAYAAGLEAARRLAWARGEVVLAGAIRALAEKPQEAPATPEGCDVADKPETAVLSQHSGATAPSIITRALDAFNARPGDAQDARLAAMFAAVDPVALAAALKAEGGS